jgi:hypothetical protein
VNYAKLLEMNSFFTLHIFLEVGQTQDLPSKIWQTLGDALTVDVDLRTILFPFLFVFLFTQYNADAHNTTLPV